VQHACHLGDDVGRSIQRSSPQKAVAQPLVERLVERGQDAEHAPPPPSALRRRPSIRRAARRGERRRPAHGLARVDQAQDLRAAAVDPSNRRVAVAHLSFHYTLTWRTRDDFGTVVAAVDDDAP
jgi:hypothetical protein